MLVLFVHSSLEIHYWRQDAGNGWTFGTIWSGHAFQTKHMKLKTFLPTKSQKCFSELKKKKKKGYVYAVFLCFFFLFGI